MLTLFLLLFSEFSHAKSDRTNPELVLAHRYIKYLYSNVKVGTSMFFIMCFIIRNSCDRYVSSISFPKSYSCYQAIACRYSQYLYCSVADTVLEISGLLVEYFIFLSRIRVLLQVLYYFHEKIKAVLRIRNYLFSTPGPPLSLISAPASAPAIYCHLKLYNNSSTITISNKY